MATPQRKRRRLHPLAGLLVFLLAIGVAIIRPLEDSTPTQVVGPTTTTAPVSMEELIRRAVERPLCEAPPVTLTKEMQELVDKMTATLPLPPNVTGDTTPGAGVMNIHRRLTPC